MRDLNDLSFFAAVVGQGGFSAAARLLGVPKSRISRRVALLEAQLGVRLIERTTRRFSVTEVGQQVYTHARAALAEAEAVEEVAMRLKAEPQGLVRISCPLGVEQALSRRLPGFLAQYPRLRVQIVVTNRRVDLIGEGIDVAIRVREKLDTDADLQLKIIGTSHVYLVAAPALLDAVGRPRTLADLGNLPTLGHTDRPGLDQWLLVHEDGQRESVALEPRVSTLDFATLLQAALDGLGIAPIPDIQCRAALAAGTLERVLPEWSGPDGIIHIVFTSRRGLLPGVRAVIDLAAAALAMCPEGER